MIEIRRILCPIDFSDYSRRALEHALALARWYEATVTVLHVCSTGSADGFGGMPIVAAAVDRDRLLADTRAFARTEGAPGVTIEAVVREGNPAAEILKQASDMPADLLVIGTHGRSGFDRLVLGSVAEKVLRKTGAPVLTVPAQSAGAASAGVLYRRILCPVDFSDASLNALKYAISVAQEADGHLTVLHVVAHEFENAADATTSTLSDAGITIASFVKQREEALRRRLQQAVATAPEFCSVESLMTHGKPWREVLRVATERQSDLIVMGVQGRGAADLVFFGSTTQHVVREASCPVLTLRRG